MPIPPKRLSVMASDPHFDLVAFDPKLKVALNGVTQTDCVAYDQVAGWVRRCKVADDGRRFVIVNDEIVIEQISGVVSVWIEE